MITIQNKKGYVIGYKHLTFSGGEEHVVLDSNYIYQDNFARIIAYLRSSTDVMKLLMVTDALRRVGAKEIHLVCPYFPYARQDRVCNLGEGLGIKVMADIINAQNYASVEIWDAHSDVTPALLNRCINVPMVDLTKDLPIRVGEYCFVAPDAGAIKKVSSVAKHFMSPMICGSKIRDTQTGEITGSNVESLISPCGKFNFSKNWNFIIADDICDGGRTFTELAKVLKEQAPGCQVHLYVTHGIFSRGFAVLKYNIDRIYCPNIWSDRFKEANDGGEYLISLRKL